MSQTRGTTAEKAAIQIFSVERTHKPPEPENAPFERRFRNQERNPFLGWNAEPHSIRNYQIVNAVLDGKFRGLFNSDGFIKGTGYLIPDDFMSVLDIDETQLVRATDDGTAIVGCNVAYANYFHWITQALPAIDSSLRRLARARNACLVLPVLNSWQEESLRLLGYSGIKRFVVDDPAKQYAFNRVEYSEILNGGAAFCLSESTYQTYSRLRQTVEIPSADRKKIYVARTDAPSRRMRNEGAVIEEVRKRGYEVVVPGTLTFTEQIRLFRGADLVVAPHGAGLTNIVFCEPGTLVYELLPSHYTNACFCNLAHICKLGYWSDAFESQGDGLPNLREWESDTALVTERLDEIDTIFTELQEEEESKIIPAMDFLRGSPGRVSGLRVAGQLTGPQVSPNIPRQLWRMLFRR